MESQPQNPEFRNNPENSHPWYYKPCHESVALYEGSYNQGYTEFEDHTAGL